MRWSPDLLAEHAQGTLLRRGSREIAGAFLDSRNPLPGGLFVPIVASRDGHAFIAAAVSAGASAVLVARGRPAVDGNVTVVEVDDTLAALTRLAAAARARVAGPVVSITGSNGKTTTRAMVEAVLRSARSDVLGTRGNLNNHLGVPLTLLGPPHDAGAVVVELGMSAPGENDRLAAIVRPTVTVITSVALEHLEFMGSIEAIAAAEAEPIRHVAEGGALVIPSDEPLLRPHVPSDGRIHVRTFGPDDDATVRVVDVELSEVTLARLALPDGTTVSLRLQAFGLHNARNAAAALCVGLQLGLPIAPMVAALEAVTPVGDRGRIVPWGHHLVIADCYNANPGSVEAALRSLAGLRRERGGQLVAVVGDMLELGPRSEALHAEAGALAAALGIDRLIAFGPLAAAAAEEACRRGLPATTVIGDVDAVVQAVRSSVDGTPGAVLIKGSRGMRLERVVEALVGHT